MKTICELIIGKEVIEKCIRECVGFDCCRYWVCVVLDLLLLDLIVMIIFGSVYFIYKKYKKKNEKTI